MRVRTVPILLALSLVVPAGVSAVVGVGLDPGGARGVNLASGTTG
jgi:hypothetical protein